MKKAASHLILGIDVGSVSVNLAALNSDGRVVHKATAYHHGEVKPTLTRMLDEDIFKSVGHVAKTASTPSFIDAHTRVDEQVAVIRSAKQIHKSGLDGILHIGGEKFSLSLFDDLGNYSGARHNTSCAAGTGSFLDQQAGRLHLSGSEQISAMALENDKPRPDIATRCAVFAKTDLPRHRASRIRQHRPHPFPAGGI